jgi:hypothetical protein
MIEALQEQICMLQSMIIQSVNDELSSSKFQERKTLLEKLLKECKEIKPTNLDEKIDLSVVRMKLLSIAPGMHSVTRTIRFFEDIVNKEMTWKMFYEEYPDIKTFLESRNGYGRKTLKMIQRLLEEFGYPKLFWMNWYYWNKKKSYSASFFISIILFLFFQF